MQHVAIMRLDRLLCGRIGFSIVLAITSYNHVRELRFSENGAVICVYDTPNANGTDVIVFAEILCASAPPTLAASRSTGGVECTERIEKWLIDHKLISTKTHTEFRGI